MPIFRRANCIITASGIFTLCKRLYSMLDESILIYGVAFITKKISKHLMIHYVTVIMS